MAVWWLADRLMPPPTQPAWLLEARTRPLAELGYTWGTDLILRQLDHGRVPAKQAAPAAQAMPAPSYPMQEIGTAARRVRVGACVGVSGVAVPIQKKTDS